MPLHGTATAFVLIQVRSGPKSLHKIILQAGHFIGFSLAQKLFGIAWNFGKCRSCSSGSLAIVTLCRRPAAFPGSAARKNNTPCFSCTSKSHSMFCQCPPLFKAPLAACWGHYFSPSFIGSRGFFLVLKGAPMDHE